MSFGGGGRGGKGKRREGRTTPSGPDPERGDGDDRLREEVQERAREGELDALAPGFRTDELGAPDVVRAAGFFREGGGPLGEEQLAATGGQHGVSWGWERGGGREGERRKGVRLGEEEDDEEEGDGSHDHLEPVDPVPVDFERLRKRAPTTHSAPETPSKSTLEDKNARSSSRT